MEVWLESLSMHLSVCMPLPSDLLFDIYNFRGSSPSSSGSTTPEGIPSESRSPNLKTIKEGKKMDTTDGVKRSLDYTDISKSDDIKNNINSYTNNVESIDKTPIVKNFENVKISEDNKNVYKSESKMNKFSVCSSSTNNTSDETKNTNLTLRKVPKTFTRNRFRHCQEINKVPELNNISRISKMPRFTKIENENIPQNNLKFDKPDFSHSKSDSNLLKKERKDYDYIRSYSIPNEKKSTINDFSRSYSTSDTQIPNSYTVPDNLSISVSRNVETTLPDIVSCTVKKSSSSNILNRGYIRQTSLGVPTVSNTLELTGVPTLTKYELIPCASGSMASTLVRNIVDTLNRNDRVKNDNAAARNSNGKNIIRSNSPIESTAL